MRTLIKTGVSLLLLAFLLIGMSFSVLRAKGTSNPAHREGRVLASETRKLGTGISTVELDGPIDLTLRQGAVSSLVVRGEQRLLQNVETTQEGDTLHINTTGMLLHHRQPLQVTLVLPSVSTLNIRGSGESTVNGFSGDHLELNLDGSGNVKFNGRFKDVDAAMHGTGEMELNGGSSEKVDVELVGSGQLTVVGNCKQFKAAQSGSGDLNAEHLAADEAEIELRGSGTSVINASKLASVNVHGSGDVNVYGSPAERRVSRTGSGEVKFRH
jgi:hypothetical protein